MINQSVHIIELDALYSILNEIENNFHFKIFNYPDKNIFLNQVNSNQINLDNSLILVKKKIHNYCFIKFQASLSISLRSLDAFHSKTSSAFDGSAQN